MMEYAGDTYWRRFVLAYGWGARAAWLAAVVGRTIDEIERLRRTGACAPQAVPMEFAELWALYHGRPPADEDWPPPNKFGELRSYEWLAPEIALLASLVGQMGTNEIARILTERLRQVTGDPDAERNPQAVQVRMNKIGLQSSDVLGGITIPTAGQEIGSLAMVQQAIEKGTLTARRVGRLWVIPHEAWAAWKTSRTFPPDGYVPLSDYRERLGIRSDKLSEFARMGHVPTAVRCNPYGRYRRSTQYGAWYVDPAVGEALVADRQAGRPMPWHGKAMPDNLRRTFQLWTDRRHPDTCETCAQIWGANGPPQSYEEFERNYPPLAHGAKRHLTRPWSPGLTLAEVAAHAGRSEAHVRRAIDTGVLLATWEGRHLYVSRTEATRWVARKCPSGEGEKSWIALATAVKQYLFTPEELERFINDGMLTARVGTHGAARGVVYVSPHQCGQLRAKLGFSEQEAADRAGISIEDLRRLLVSVNWRGANRIPLVTVQAVIQRRDSRQGHTVVEAAAALGVEVQWVQDRVRDGTVVLQTTDWAPERPYLSEPMMRRLRNAMERPETVGGQTVPDLEGWLTLGQAADDAGVSTSTMSKWGTDGDVERRRVEPYWMYRQDSLRARARTYWATVRRHRAIPPAWLHAEQCGLEPPPPAIAPAPMLKRVRNVPAGRLHSVETAVATLISAGFEIVQLRPDRYLVDGIAVCSGPELILRARRLEIPLATSATSA